MDVAAWWNAAVDFARENETAIEILLFVLGFAESLVFISFFVPASALFLGIAALEGAAGNPFLPILLAGAAGCFAGDMVSFVLGSWMKENLDKRWPFNRNPFWLLRTQALFERRGMSAIYISKFIGPLRPVVPFVAGAMQMRTLPFAIASLGSSLIWSAAFLAPSYYGLKLLHQ
ncbi:MAG: hypothetical protein RLZ98_1613 [Pseudomonadota bacterium]|jgi:undecaprenyl-diphosphatase